MRRRKVWQTLAVGVVVTVAVATGCSNGAQPQSAPVQGATVPTAAPTTTTTNPYAVPDQIDAAYVNRVLAGLDAIEGDIFREVRAQRNITPELVHRVEAFHTNLNTAAVLVNRYQFDMARAFEGYYESPGNSRTVVAELITVKPGCIYARVDRDHSALGPTATGVRTAWVALRPVPASSINPVGWAYEYNGVTSSRNAPEKNPCDGF